MQPLQIKSAVAVEGLKGYIYIEAYKQTHVKQVNIIVVVVCVCACVRACVRVGKYACVCV